jgi:hypothetical protein
MLVPISADPRLKPLPAKPVLKAAVDPVAVTVDLGLAGIADPVPKAVAVDPVATVDRDVTVAAMAAATTVVDRPKASSSKS